MDDATYTWLKRELPIADGRLLAAIEHDLLIIGFNFGWIAREVDMLGATSTIEEAIRLCSWGMESSRTRAGCFSRSIRPLNQAHVDFHGTIYRSSYSPRSCCRTTHRELDPESSIPIFVIQSTCTTLLYY